MRQKTIALRNISVLITLTLAFIACEKDFSNFDSDLTDDSVKNFNSDSRDYPVLSYTQPINVVQTSNVLGNPTLNSALFGYYNDPLLGGTTFNFVSALTADSYAPDFGEEVELDSVVLTIPLFSTQTDVDDEGLPVYRLDSVYNNQPIDISVYRSNYFLRDKDPNSSVNSDQRFYSNQSDGINQISDAQLENRLLFYEPNFVASEERIKLVNEFDGRDSTYFAPAIRLVLDEQSENGAAELEYWKNIIIDKADDSELSNNENFRNYFRGVYLKATPINDQGSAILLDVASGASITLHYTKKAEEAETTREQDSYVLTLQGRQATFIKNNFVIPEGNDSDGDENLIIKGGSGSIAAIELFNGENFDDDGMDNAFEAFKKDFVNTDEDGNFVSSRKLINEAHLVFYVNQDAISGLSAASEPNRLFLYDLENGVFLQDFLRSPFGQLQRENESTDGKGIQYRLKLTEHINNLLLKDSTNVKLGVAVLGSVQTERNFSQLDVISQGDERLSLPTSTITTPRSTILYGNNSADPSKRLMLEIYYTNIENQ